MTRLPRRNPRITPAEIAASAVVNLRNLVSGALLDKSPTLDKVKNILVISLTLTKLKIMRKKWDIPPPRPNIRLGKGRGGWVWVTLAPGSSKEEEMILESRGRR